jgi:putative ABC transport system permease protein
MLSVTLKGLFAHKLRLLLSASAVMLGIAFLAGTMVLTDTIQHGVDEVQAQLEAGSDVSVRSESETGGTAAQRAPVPESVLTEVRQVDGVEHAVGSSLGFAQLVADDGSLIGSGVTVGMSMPPEDLGLLEVREGAAPRGDAEVAVDVATARSSGVKVGDQVTALLTGPSRPVTVVGLVGYGSIDGIPGSSVVAFDPAVAPQLLGSPGRYASIEVSGAPGVAKADLQKRVAEVLPKELEAVSGLQVAEEGAKEAGNALKFLPTALMAFVAVSLFVGIFLIVNTFSMLVAQRSREFGLLRSVGATARQVFASVLLEALVVGAVASALGFGAGVGAAHGMNWVLGALGLDMPQVAVQVRPQVAVVSLLVGTVVTCLAAALPALRASRVPPIAAIVGLPTSTKRGRRVVGVAGGVLLLGGLATATYGVSLAGARSLPLAGVGALMTFLGLAALSSHLVRPVVTVVGRPWVPLLGVPGRLGSDNAVRNPHRTAATASALMVGLALVVLTSVFSASAKESLGRALDEGQRADYLVSSPEFTGFSHKVTEAMAARPEFDAVVGLRAGEARVAGEDTQLFAADQAGLERVLDLDMREGRVAGLAHGGVLVHKDVALRHHWQVGDLVPMQFQGAGRQRVPVRGIFAEKRLLGSDYILALPAYQKWYVEQLDLLTLVTLAPGVTATQADAAFDVVLADQPQLKPRTKAEERSEQERQLGQVLSMVTGLLGLALLIALLGIMNTLALSVQERVRELGLVRAVGMSRSQVRRTIRYEAILIALIGAVLGVGVGLSAGSAFVHVLRDKGLTDLAVPGGQIAIYVVAAAFAGVLAAAWPARRAAKLDILEAIAQE